MYRAVSGLKNGTRCGRSAGLKELGRAGHLPLGAQHPRLLSCQSLPRVLCQFQSSPSVNYMDSLWV